MKIHYVLKGFDVNPWTRITKKRSRQQTTQSATYGFGYRILYKSVWDVHKSQAKMAVRGPPGSTIIIYSSHPRATPFSPGQGIISARGSSPTSWGEFIIKRVSCSPHTQLSRPMSWGHHILEWRTTQHTKHDIELQGATVKWSQAYWFYRL